MKRIRNRTSAGREAALRLRRDALTDERRTELATLMDRLGLTVEADRLMRQGKAAEAANGMAPGARTLVRPPTYHVGQTVSSCLAKSNHWVHFCRAACWEIASQRGHCK